MEKPVKINSLAEVIADYTELGSKPDFEDVVPWFVQIASALAALENARLLLSQLDASQVVVTHKCGPMIADFIRMGTGNNGALPWLASAESNPTECHEKPLKDIAHQLAGGHPSDPALRLSSFNPTVPEDWWERCIGRQ